MDVYERAWEYAHGLYKSGTSFPRSTYLAASKFSDQEGASFNEILSVLRKEGARRRGTQLQKPKKPPPKPPEPPKGPEQLEFPFEDKLRQALGIK